MDFTRELSAFQGVIMSADNIFPFSKLTSKGGNEDKVQFVLDKLLNFFKTKDILENAIVDSIGTIRKFSLYIVFNADLKILEELVDIEEMYVFIWTTPIIPQYLMCELFWNLDMETILYEIIAYSFPPLAIEIVGAFVEHFVYFTPTECLNRLRNLTIACYTAICRLNFFELDQRFSDTLMSALHHFQKLVKYFTEPPNNHLLNTLSADELYRYKGNCLYAALLCLYECSTQFISPHERKLNKFDNIYELTYPLGSYKEDCLSYYVTNNPKEIQLVLNECLITLLDNFKHIFMEISIDIFCAWNEFEENGKTMQQNIGELAYKLRLKLLDISSLCEHPFVTMIQEIARKPVDANDLINTLSTETIIANINKNDDEKKDWLYAIQSKVHLSENKDLLQIIDDNLASYNEEQCYKLYEVLRCSIRNQDIIKPLSIKLFQNCCISDKYKILDETFFNNCLVDMEETIDYNNMLTEIFNKLVVSPNTDFTDILMLFLQNPRRVFIKIFTLAIANSQQTDIMLKAMNLLEKYSNHYYNSETESCVVKVAQNTIDNLETEVEENNFVHFMHGLKEINFILGSKLLMLIIMPNLHQSLVKRNINNINIQIKLLLDVYTIEEIIEYRAPMLAMLAQVIDIVRWRIQTFLVLAPGTMQRVLLLQKSLVTTYNGYIPEIESIWLKGLVKNLQPLNMYYYRQLWMPPGDNFVQVISGMNVTKETSTDVIIIFLTQILCSCTQQEWCDIWNSFAEFNNTSILRMFHQAMSAIVTAERTNRTDKTWLCLLYCYRNLIYVIRYKFFKEPLCDDQIMTAMRIIETIPILEEGKSEEIESLLISLLAYLSERKNDYNINLSTCLQLKQTKLDSLMHKVFSNKQN